MCDWDEARGAVSAREEERLGALVLDRRPAPVDDPEAAWTLLLAAVGREPDRRLPWSDSARTLQARVLLARRLTPAAGWPDLSDDWLAAHLPDWLGPWLVGKSRLAEVRALDLTAVLRGRLDREQARRLDAWLPEAVETPAGTRRRIDYLGGPEPVLAAPVQELFGAAVTPAIADGRLPLLVHLLSPAGRPLQVTRDLAAFWRGAWGEVRKEMRGRYPKHHWPENPATAAPVRGGRKPKGA
jgi:ATP-dependent helicase HrpB